MTGDRSCRLLEFREANKPWRFLLFCSLLLPRGLLGRSEIQNAPRMWGGVTRLPESKCICRFVFYFSLRLWGLVRLILARLIKEYEMDRQQDTAVLPPIGIFAS